MLKQHPLSAAFPPMPEARGDHGSIAAKFHHLEDELTRAKRGSFSMALHHESLAAQIEALRSSSKWFVGEVDALPRVEAIQLTDFPRAPFPVCAFDMRMMSGYNEIAASVVCVVSDAPETIVIRCYEHPLAARLATDFWFEAGEIEIDRGSGTLCARPLWMEVARDGPRTVYGTSRTQFARIVPAIYQGADKEEVPLALETNAPHKPAGGGERDYKFLINIAISLGTFLQVLNCVNVQIASVDAPKFLNKKRAAKGKPPIYSYKTLVLKSRARRQQPLGGTHESPRIHLRRGHIKHCKTGDFWWQPHVVGDRRRGVVMKDYDARGIA